jgi:hypothetical protein
VCYIKTWCYYIKMTTYKKKTKTKVNRVQTRAKTKVASNTKLKSKTKSPALPLLSRSELSAKIQWLIDLGGTVALLESVVGDLCGKKITVNELGKSVPESKRKNMLLFMKGDSDAGHWVFYNNKGVKMDPYEMQHQRPGSHQFCQTFSLIYAAGFCNADYKKDFLNKLKSGQAHFGDNIRVAAAFWRHMLTKYHNPDLSEWMIGEVQQINDELKQVQDTRTRQTNAIAEDSDAIDLPFVLSKLDDIDLYADQIAKST